VLVYMIYIYQTLTSKYAPQQLELLQ